MGYKLPQLLRPELQSPIGKHFTGGGQNPAKDVITFIKKNKPSLTISIGDYCTESLIALDFLPDIVIYDGKTQRYKTRSLDLQHYEIFESINPPEWILLKAKKVIENAINFNSVNNSRVAVRIDGEEDLLIIPAIILAPVGTIITYGQPPFANIEEGIVAVVISPSLKNKTQKLLDKFEFHEECSNGNNNP